MIKTVGQCVSREVFRVLWLERFSASKNSSVSTETCLGIMIRTVGQCVNRAVFRAF